MADTNAHRVTAKMYALRIICFSWSYIVLATPWGSRKFEFLPLGLACAASLSCHEDILSSFLFCSFFFGVERLSLVFEIETCWIVGCSWVLCAEEGWDGTVHALYLGRVVTLSRKIIPVETHEESSQLGNLGKIWRKELSVDRV